MLQYVPGILILDDGLNNQLLQANISPAHDDWTVRFTLAPWARGYLELEFTQSS